jgi:hypothetical protein
MPREYYTIAQNGDIASLRRELGRVFDSISRRLNSISQSGGDISLGGKRIINVGNGINDDDAVRLDQAFLLENLVEVILGSLSILITDNGDFTLGISTIDSGIDHNQLANLTSGDVHIQYLLLSGRIGGQALIGGLSTSIRKITFDDDITVDDFSVELDSTSNAVTATLPTAFGNAGKLLHVTAINVTNMTTLESFGAETLPDGTTSFEFLAVAESLFLKANSTETGWDII